MATAFSPVITLIRPLVPDASGLSQNERDYWLRLTFSGYQRFGHAHLFRGEGGVPSTDWYSEKIEKTVRSRDVFQKAANRLMEFIRANPLEAAKYPYLIDHERQLRFLYHVYATGACLYEGQAILDRYSRETSQRVKIFLNFFRMKSQHNKFLYTANRNSRWASVKYYPQFFLLPWSAMRVFSLLLLLLLLVPGDLLLAQKKIYILTDLEGVSGVYNFGQTREKGSPANIQACEYFMDDLAAVIEGLKDGGATEILVIDAHGNQCVIPHMMVPGALYLTGIPRPETMPGLDSSYVGLVQFGAHAMMGTQDGILHHTMSSRSEKRYWYNDIECGEMAIVAAITGYYGIPTILVTGDVATCREARKFFGNNCVTIAVKEGIAREAAILYPFEETRKALYEGARKAMEVIPLCKPYKMDLPVKGKLQYLRFLPDQSEPEVVTKEAVFNDPRDILKF